MYRQVLGQLTLPTLVSAANGARGNGNSFVTGSDDSGTVVGFESTATNFDVGVPPDGFNLNGFVSSGGEVRLVGRAGVTGLASSEGSGSVAVSGDGAKVVMNVKAPGIVGDSDPLFESVVLRDLDSGANQTVSRPPGDGPFVNVGADSFGGSVSADGRYVAFASDATGLGVRFGERAVFVRDVVTGAVTLVSREDGPGGAPLHGIAELPRISADGRRGAFENDLQDGTPGQVLVRDVPSGRTFVASRADGADGAHGDDDSFASSISDDGSRVAFVSFATNLSRMATLTGRRTCSCASSTAAGRCSSIGPATRTS